MSERTRRILVAALVLIVGGALAWAYVHLLERAQ